MSTSPSGGGHTSRPSRSRSGDGNTRHRPYYDPFDIGGRIHDAVAPIGEQLHALRASIGQQSNVLTPAQAATFAFDGKITSGRVCEYIRAKNLPEGVNLPLPARRIGSTYHIPIDRLNRWRMGEATFDDLYPWQRTKATSLTDEV